MRSYKYVFIIIIIIIIIITYVDTAFLYEERKRTDCPLTCEH